MHPNAAGAWLFPADSKSGHIEKHKEDRADLSKWGNDLRQSYRTLATIAGVSEVDAKLLMNHSIPGVNRATSPGTSCSKTISVTSSRRFPR